MLPFKRCANARAKAEREQAEVRAREDKANDARVVADLEIAKKQNELAIEQANLKRQSDVQLAQANAPMALRNKLNGKKSSVQLLKPILSSNKRSRSKSRGS